MPRKGNYALVGRPPGSSARYEAKHRPILMAKWTRAMYKAMRYLNNNSPHENPQWVALFNSIGDRVGYSRRTNVQMEGEISAGPVAREVLLGLMAEMKAIAAIQPEDPPYGDSATSGNGITH